MPEPLLWFPRTHHIDLLTQAKQCFVRSISTRVPNLSRRISSKDHRTARSGDQSGKMAGRPLLWAPRSRRAEDPLVLPTICIVVSDWNREMPLDASDRILISDWAPPHSGLTGYMSLGYMP